MRLQTLVPLVTALLFVSWSDAELNGQIARIPVSLTVTTASTQVEVGRSVNLEVSLKNYKNEVVAALDDLTVTVQLSSRNQEQRIMIPKGQTSAVLTVTPQDSGVLRVRATAPQVSSKPTILLVTPAVVPRRDPLPSAPVRRGSTPRGFSTARPEASPQNRPGGRTPFVLRDAPAVVPGNSTDARSGTAREPQAAAASTAANSPSESRALSTPPLTPVPPSPPQPSGPVTLVVEPTSSELYPEDGTWTTELVATLLTGDGRLVPAAEEVRAQLSARIGHLSANEVVIPAGTYKSGPVTLASSRPGTDVIRVRSSLSASEINIVYHVPQPAQLRLEAHPREVVNSGRTPVTTTVMLLDAANHPTSYVDRDLTLVLTPSLGSIEPRQATIPPNQFFAEASLTSARHGEARITANAQGFAEAATTVQFFFPWLLVAMAGGGGTLGALVRTWRASFSKRWVANLIRNLVVGFVLGLFFYLAAFFGAFTAVPSVQLPIEIEAVPTVNELGALLLGFVGGVVGRSFWIP